MNKYSQGTTVVYKEWKKHPAYCPVKNFRDLAELRAERLPVDFEEPIFRLANGDLVTQYFMNRLLERLLRPYFPDTMGKWTCHSFRAGVAAYMASNPDTFNEEETKEAGGWDSDAVDRYTRLNGEARLKCMEKFMDFLR